ncbi:MAG: hypothetical protein IPM76_18935 [Chloroflexi bacterium]|nr:hypothetical protein [Chloroflexota bacterium]
MDALILYVSIGSGHRRAAEVLAETFTRQVGWTCLPVDVLTLVWSGLPSLANNMNAWLLKLAASFYEHYWGDHEALSALDKVLGLTNMVGLMRELAAKHQPAVFVCTHALPARILSLLWLKDGRSQPTINVATDFMVNGLWPVERMSAFVVASEAARARLVRRGYPTQHIHALGIPVAAHFATQAESQTGIRSRLGLANKPTLLAITGSLHNEPYVQSARVMSELFALWGSEETAVSPHADLQIVVITGRNRENLLILQSLVQRLPWPVTLLPFVDNIGEWMVASDLMVTKPGGVTTAEALSCAVPMLLLGIGPGQEQANADLLVNEGCAVIGAKETAILGAQILRLLGDDERLAQMRAACWGLARPDAAQEIARLAQCVAQAETIYE